MHLSQRILTVCFAALQLASSGAAAVADGILASGSANAPGVHVEGEGDSHCPAMHSPDCGLCRHLATHSLRVARTEAFELCGSVVKEADCPSIAPRQAARAATLPRAPPRFS